jgi:hypothetical protein
VHSAVVCTVLSHAMAAQRISIDERWGSVSLYVSAWEGGRAAGRLPHTKERLRLWISIQARRVSAPRPKAPAVLPRGGTILLCFRWSVGGQVPAGLCPSMPRLTCRA